MKSCSHCGQNFKDHVDFCFYDGEVLVAVAGAAESEALDAPAPPPRAQGDQSSPAAAGAVPARSQDAVGRGRMPVDPSDDPLASRPPAVERSRTPAGADDATATPEAPVVDPTADTPLPAPKAAERSQRKPFVSEDDTIPIPIPPKASDPVANSNDPTQPPAPDRSSTPIPVTGATPATSAGQGSQAKTPIVGEGERAASPAGAAAGGASGQFHESSQVAPSTYAAAPQPPTEEESEENQGLFLYGAMALGAAVLLLGGVTVGMFALGIIGGDGASAQNDTPVAPASPSPSPAPVPAQPVDVAPEPAPAPVPAPVEAPEPAPVEAPDPVPMDAPEPAPVAPAPAPAPAPQPAAPQPAAPQPAAPVPAPAPAPTNDGATEAAAPAVKQKGRVGFLTRPPGELYIAGEPLGQTSGLPLSLDYGSYDYEVRLDGYETLKGVLVVDQPDMGNISGDLKPLQMEKVKVFVVGVVGMRVLIDDVERRPPFHLELPVGPLTVKVYNPNSNIWEAANITVSPDTSRINLNEQFPDLETP